MADAPDVFLEHVLVTIHRLSGRRLSDGADKLIGAEHGVTGWDSRDLLEDMEEAYGIDLQPFAESRATERRGWFCTHKVSGDATPRELADQIVSLVVSADNPTTRK